MKARAFSLLFIFILFSSPVSAFTPPSWFKNGTYVTYAVLPGKEKYEGYPNMLFYTPSKLSDETLNAFIDVLENGPNSCQKLKAKIENSGSEYPLYGLSVFGPIFVTFNLTNVTNSSAVVVVTLTLTNFTPTLHCTVSSLTLRGRLFLNVTDGYYYLNGTKIGRPSFFILPYHLPERKDLLYKASILRRHGFTLVGDLEVSNVTFTQGKLVHTFVKTFHPPLIGVKSNRQPILYQKKGYLSSSIGMDSLYDIDTGVAVSIGDLPYPELYTLGVVKGHIFNHYSAEMNDKIDFSREYWPYEFVLYETNIKFPEERIGRTPDTILKYYLLAGLIILTASLTRRWRK
ncbi:hypothetical protein [Thermococcus sp. 21S7]|uniref:hypothetical protein n=1 Tax=Thermococcus sp. 21S7 TaxID=1638221 RepID=UPI00143C4E52|nr:hypothetical protein [Thermococcus sp. 21S7]NJE61543.1 hypothetical protein [Thermococcus sp. 21S7]